MTANLARGVDRVVAPGATLQKLAGDFKFTEGPTCDAAGNVFFTDQPNDRILKWSVEGKLSTFLQPAGRANGMCFDAEGQPDRLRRREERAVVHRAGRQGHRDPRASTRASGSTVRTTSGCGPTARSTSPTRSTSGRGGRTTRCRRTASTSTSCPPTASGSCAWPTTCEKPNGIIGTPDGKTLFVADIEAGKTYRYDIQPDGSLAGKTLVVEHGSDGMTLDDEGNLYLTGDGVTGVRQAGRQIEHIPIPDERWTANVSFGGKDRQTLFITASTGLYAVRMRVKGANAAK